MSVSISPIIDEELKAKQLKQQREADQAAVDVLNANLYLGYSDWEISYGTGRLIYVDHIFTPSNTFWRIELAAAVALANTMPKVMPVKK